jgi:hypothetical protein
VTTAKDTFAPWRGTVNDYRDTHLLTLTAPVAEIEVRDGENFTLQQQGTNGWIVAGEKFTADAENVQTFLKLLANLRVSEFVKDAPTVPVLQDYGLVAPSRQITLRGKAGDTNSTLVQILFGAADTNRVLVKRSDEEFVYAITPADFEPLFLLHAGWHYRNRNIWNFSKTNVVQITLRQNGQTRQIVRTGENKWSLAPGSQGVINPKSIEQTVDELSNLNALGWVGRNFTAEDGEKKFGLNPNNLSVTIELKTGEKLSLDFGLEIPTSQTALAAVTLDGERWAFVFPVIPFQMTAANLTIPPKAP